MAEPERSNPAIDLSIRRTTRSGVGRGPRSGTGRAVVDVVSTSPFTRNRHGTWASIPALVDVSPSIAQAQEAERRRIARDLHDVVGQDLLTVRLHLQAAQRTRDPVAVDRLLDTSTRVLDGVLRQVRDFALGLRPPVLDDLGLVAALRSHLDREAPRAGYRARLVADPIGRLESDLEIVLFRIAEEALTNVARHAAARTVRVVIRVTQDALKMTIRDDGIGFDVATAAARTASGESMGLKSMQERAALAGGYLKIDSAPGRGARVRVLFFRTGVPEPTRPDAGP